MLMHAHRQALALMALLLLCLTACGGLAAAPTPVPKPKVLVVIDAGSENDKSFNEYTLSGARAAAEATGLDLGTVLPQSAADYERAIESAIEAEQPALVITVGFRMGEATARSASRHPEVHFAIVDTAFYPGAGCASTVSDCYSTEGGLGNVTSLLFAENELGYLAGTLAGCMTQTGVVASVAGVDIPPVMRFVQGFEKGARAVRPEITTLNQYIPDFNDPETGQVVAQGFISQGADVIFGVAGKTGNGALLAAHQSGRMAIGVDVDQYYAYPEVGPALLTSASKNVDVAADAAVRDFAAGRLAPGIRLATLANGGVGLAPYHDWEDRIPTTCRQQVELARAAVIADPGVASVP
jgi:basic membrane protein A